MESKKINQLATELAPDLSDLTIIGDPTTGISKKITLSQMASLFTGTVEEYANLAAFPLVGVADTIYIALDTNILYRWNTGTSAYVELSPNIVSSLVFNDANGFDGTINLVGSVATLTITTALTTGSVGFIGSSGALLQDNANFFWDDTNNRLGLGTNAPTTALDVFGSGIIGRINGTSTNNAYLGFSSAGTNKWSVGNVQSDHRFRIFSEANSAELITILQTGEFGIGIANPTTKFHIDGAASALIANLDANVSVAKSLSFRSDNSNRINLEVSGTESGSDAGANFFIRRYSDAGALIDTPLTITRSTGAITLATALSGTTATFSSSVTTTKIITTGGNGAEIFNASTATTGSNYFNIRNTGAILFIGIESSTGGSLQSGCSAYASVITTGNATDLSLGTGQVERLKIAASTGAATFTSSVSATTGTTGAAIKLTGFTNYGTIQDVNDVRRIWFENTGSFRTIFDLPSSGTSFAYRTNAGTSLLSLTSAGVLDLPFGQITFPATQNASSNANTLDDYEEGTFTPTVSYSTSGSPTYFNRAGFYTKIGRQVTINLMVGFAENTGVGNVSIGNLPFTSNSTSLYRLAGSVQGSGMTGLVGGLVAYIGATQTSIEILQTNGGVYSGIFVTNANTSSDTDIVVGITYFTS